MSDELLPITEADVVKDAELVSTASGVRVVVRGLLDDEPSVVLRWPNGLHTVASMAYVVETCCKRAPKPPRYVVELRPPKAGERYVDRWGRVLVAQYDFTTDRAVIVEELS